MRGLIMIVLVLIFSRRIPSTPACAKRDIGSFRHQSHDHLINGTPRFTGTYRSSAKFHSASVNRVQLVCSTGLATNEAYSKFQTPSSDTAQHIDWVLPS